MAAVDENFLVKLQAVLPNTTIEEGTISEFTGQTRVWFKRAREATELNLDGSDGLTETEFDLEVHSTDIAEAQALAASIRANAAQGGLNGFFGQMGDMPVLGAFVEEQSDEYQPKLMVANDLGFHVPCLKVRVIFDGAAA